MKAFYCQKCHERLFFENSVCLSCNSALGFLPDLLDLSVISPAGNESWSVMLPKDEARKYRKCHNDHFQRACTWMVPLADPNPFCRSCRLNCTIPDLRAANHRTLWRKMELAKRRLIYTLLRLGLPVVPKIEDAERGLAFDFLADIHPQVPVGERILTGHSDGVITINLGEADDAARERVRLELRESYRTLLGHFRHESGHYFWDLLVRNHPEIDSVRATFGDERVDYASALQRYYAMGPKAGWDATFVTPYASSHPWEDWAETWAHYLHIVDTLETGAAGGLQVQTADTHRAISDPAEKSFATIRQDWHAVRFIINSLNRSMGMPDPYPFVLSDGAAAKLEFVHQWIATAANSEVAKNNGTAVA